MLTPQEISERELVKAVFGGYDVAVVDDFLEAITADYSALYKENAILKSKINVSNNDTALEAGCIGYVAGCKVYVSNNVVVAENVHKCMARSKRAIAFAEQLSEIDAYRPERRFADAVKGLHLYGAQVIYPSEMVRLDLTVAA